MSTSYCFVSRCKNTRKNNRNITFFSFPKDQERCQKWLVAINKENINISYEKLYKFYKVCGIHFSQKMFKNDLRNRLFDHAYPDININSSRTSIDGHNYLNVNKYKNINPQENNNDKMLFLLDTSDLDESSSNMQTNTAIDPLEINPSCSYEHSYSPASVGHKSTSTTRKQYSTEISKVCRLCFTIFENESLLKSFSNEITELVSQAICIDLNEMRERLPERICINCEGKIVEFMNFKQKCLQVDQSVKNQIKILLNSSSVMHKNAIANKITENQLVEHIKEEIIDLDEMCDLTGTNTTSLETGIYTKQMNININTIEGKERKLIAILPKRVKKFSCKICSITFNSLEDLLHHSKIHFNPSSNIVKNMDNSVKKVGPRYGFKDSN